MNALQAANEVIDAVNIATGLDYSQHREEIAKLFEDYLWNGEWDMATDLEEANGLENLRLIQEDEFDQHMDTDDLETICYSAGHYVLFA